MAAALYLNLGKVVSLGKMQAAFKAIQSHSTSLTNTFSIVLVGATELLIGYNIFQCPCETDDLIALLNPQDPKLTPHPGRRYYAAAFILWPAIAAFFMALAVSGSVLRCLIEHRCTNCNLRRHCRGLRFMIENAVSVFVPPLAWCIIVFMDGRYYTCAVSKLPDNCLPDVKKLNASMAENRGILERENQWHRSTSQIIALTFLGAGIMLAGLFVICGHLLSKLPYYQRRYMKLYREKEMETFAEVSEASLTSELKEKWELFFEKARDADWEEVSELPIGQPIALKGRHFYSHFHGWSSETEKPLNEEKYKPLISTGDAKIDEACEAHPDETVADREKHVVSVRNVANLSGLPIYSSIGKTLTSIPGNNEPPEESATNKYTKGTQTKPKHFPKKNATKSVGFYDNPTFGNDIDRTTSKGPTSPFSDNTYNETDKKYFGKAPVSLPKIEVADM